MRCLHSLQIASVTGDWLIGVHPYHSLASLLFLAHAEVGVYCDRKCEMARPLRCSTYTSRRIPARKFVSEPSGSRYSQAYLGPSMAVLNFTLHLLGLRRKLRYQRIQLAASFVHAAVQPLLQLIQATKQQQASWISQALDYAGRPSWYAVRFFSGFPYSSPDMGGTASANNIAEAALAGRLSCVIKPIAIITTA